MLGGRGRLRPVLEPVCILGFWAVVPHGEQLFLLRPMLENTDVYL